MSDKKALLETSLDHLSRKLNRLTRLCNSKCVESEEQFNADELMLLRSNVILLSRIIRDADLSKTTSMIEAHERVREMNNRIINCSPSGKVPALVHLVLYGLERELARLRRKLKKEIKNK